MIREINLEILLFYSLINRSEITLCELNSMIDQLKQKIDNVFVDVSRDALRNAVDTNLGVFKVVDGKDSEGKSLLIIRKKGGRLHNFTEPFLDMCYRHSFAKGELEIIKTIFTQINNNKENNMTTKQNTRSAFTTRVLKSTSANNVASDIEQMFTELKDIFKSNPDFDQLVSTTAIVALKLKVASMLALRYNVSVETVLELLKTAR